MVRGEATARSVRRTAPRCVLATAVALACIGSACGEDGMTAGASTTGVGESATAGRGDATMAPSGTDAGDGVPFVDTPDGGGTAHACDLWSQDCPSGEKCMPWANDGGDAWNATRCTPLAADPGAHGDQCTAMDGPTSGLDDCASSSMCWDVDDEGNGTCVGFCSGSPDAPLCEDPDHGCAQSNGGVLRQSRRDVPRGGTGLRALLGRRSGAARPGRVRAVRDPGVRPPAPRLPIMVI